MLRPAEQLLMSNRVVEWTKVVATTLERLLALGVLVGSIYFAFHSALVLMEADWRSAEAYYQLIYRILLIVIGVELIRTLVTHDLMAILELIAFVVARKMLKPELTSLDILVGAAAFGLLLAARRYFFPATTTLWKEQET